MDEAIPDAMMPAGAEAALLAAVLDQTHDCIKLLDLDGTIRHVNRQGALAMELSSPSVLIGQPYLERWPEGARAEAKRALAAARKGAPARFTASRPRLNGRPSWWDVTVSPVRAADGAITQFVTIARDMTVEVEERQRVEAISLEMRHRLKNALTVASGIVMMGAPGAPGGARVRERRGCALRAAGGGADQRTRSRRRPDDTSHRGAADGRLRRCGKT